MLLTTATERTLLRDCLGLMRVSAATAEAVLQRMNTLTAIARLAEFLLAHPHADESEIISVVCEM